MENRWSSVRRMVLGEAKLPTGQWNAGQHQTINSIGFTSQLLRPDIHQMQEPACLARAMNLLRFVVDNYLDSLTIDHENQFTAKYQMDEGEN